MDFSLRATAAGLVIGSLVLCANFQFGLQTGWVSMMSMPAALLGFAFFRVMDWPLSPQENIYIQSVAVAVGTAPLSFGFIGAIPAIERLLTPEEGRFTFGTAKLVAWSFGVGFIGIFAAVLFRRYILPRKQFVFPSASAAAALIGVLHDKPVAAALPEGAEAPATSYYQNMLSLGGSFAISSLYSIIAHIIPVVRRIPLFGSAAARYLWVFEPSPGYIGQGIIMGLHTTASMLLGALSGWLVLGPLAKAQGWAPGDIQSWNGGVQGWIMWTALAIMVADTVVPLGMLAWTHFEEFVVHALQNWKSQANVEADIGVPLVENIDGADSSAESIEAGFSSKSSKEISIGSGGLLVSSILCVVVVKMLFTSFPVVSMVFAVSLSPLLALMGVCVLGETDLNPVSSIAKFTQFLFGLIVRNHPFSVLFNILTGAISETGAQQAGDLMQDYKTGQHLDAPYGAQTVGMFIGTCWSVVLSAAVHALYNAVYEIPGDLFRIPSAYLWVDCARLMTGQSLPPRAGLFALIFGTLFTVLALVRQRYPSRWIPSGVAVGIGMYNVPSFTLARFVGGLAEHLVVNYWPELTKQVHLVVLASGLILGEGLTSVLALVATLISSSM